MVRRTFLATLSKQVERKSKSAVGRELGLSHDAIRLYLKGESPPSKTVLLLAEPLWGGDQAGEWPASPDTEPDNLSKVRAPTWLYVLDPLLQLRAQCPSRCTLLVHTVGMEIKECLRCGEPWCFRGTGRPLRCGKCKSPYWDRRRRGEQKILEETHNLATPYVTTQSENRQRKPRLTCAPAS